MRESPRIRRLRSDRRAIEQLAQDSTILEFEATGAPSDHYVVRFFGRGVCISETTGQLAEHDRHVVRIELGASYPRAMPELIWVSPIFHPNISAGGFVCLGGYGSHWSPSLNLDQLCEMLWDMIRFANYDVASPYNREAAVWARSQTDYDFPLDRRPLRDRLAKVPSHRDSRSGGSRPDGPTADRRFPDATESDAPMVARPEDVEPDIEIVDAELAVPPQTDPPETADEQDIIFLD